MIAISLAVLGIVSSAQADLIRVQMSPNASFSGNGGPYFFSGVESSAAAADPVFGSDGSNAWNHLTIDPGPTSTANPSFSNLVE